MRCATCKKPFDADQARYRPFCSERCKLVDLGNWLDGTYAIPGEPATEEDLASDLPENENPDSRRR